MKKFGLKFFSVMIALLVVVVLTGCAIKEGTKIEFTKLPVGVYTTYPGNIDLEEVEIKVNDGNPLTLKEAKEQHNVKVTGDTWNGVGDYTLVVILDNAAITFNYYVVDTIPPVKVDTDWEGDGTATNPYQIRSEDQLKGLAAVVNKKATVEGLDPTCKNTYFQLKNDIKLSAGWEPIGAGNRKQVVNYFAGTFDGANHTISGLTNVGYNPVDVAGTYNASSLTTVKDGYVFGLFGIIKNATIKNIKMDNVYTEDTSFVIDSEVVQFTLDSVGAIAGYSIDADNTIENCHVLSGTLNGYDAIGGIFGRSYASLTINNCSNAADISCDRKDSGKCGGIIGAISHYKTAYHITVSNCVNYANVVSNGSLYAGAICGQVYTHDKGLFEEFSNKNQGRIFAKGNETKLFGTCMTGKFELETSDNWKQK